MPVPELGLLAQQSAPPSQITSVLIMVAPMMAFYYFLILRPQQKHQQAQQALRDGLKKGDRVVTVAGIHGTIAAVATTTVDVVLAPQVTVRFEKAAISRLAAADAAAGEG